MYVLNGAILTMGRLQLKLTTAPNAPTFGARGKGGYTNDLNKVITGMAQRICNALTTTMPVSSVATHSSPTNVVGLRSKYMQQLSELVKLRDIGVLSKDEYEERRLVIATSMQN